MSVSAAIQALAAGRMVVVVDAPEREDEGDLVIAAEHVTAEAVNFMATHARGLICVPMESARLDALRIGPMVAHNRDARGTAWRMSVDHRGATTTGISAHDRAATIRALADPATEPQDLCRPGHVFPLAGRPGGVLERAGHTEAALDLMRLAGLRAAAVICEIADDDGRMARLPALRRFAAQHDLPLLTIAELSAHMREAAERLVVIGDHAVVRSGRELTVVVYRESRGALEHHAIVAPAPSDGSAVPLVAVHAECFGGDVLGSARCGCARQLDEAIAAVAEHPGGGVVAYVREAGGGGDCPLPASGRARQRRARIARGMLMNLGIERARLLDPSSEARRASRKGAHLQGKADMPNVLDSRRQAR